MNNNNLNRLNNKNLKQILNPAALGNANTLKSMSGNISELINNKLNKGGSWITKGRVHKENRRFFL